MNITFEEYLVENMGTGGFGDIPVSLRDRLIRAGEDNNIDVLETEIIRLVRTGQNSTDYGRAQRKQMNAAYQFGKNKRSDEDKHINKLAQKYDSSYEKD